MTIKLIAYGAAAEAPVTPNLVSQFREGLKHEYFSQRALLTAKFTGCVPPVLCEDHNCAWYINYGDAAIADTLVEHVTENVAVTVIRRNWQFGRERGWLDDVTGPLLVMVCGGGYLFLDEKSQLSPRLASDLAICRAHGATWGLAGVGVNQLGQQFESLEWEPTTADIDTLAGLIGGAKFVSVRDKPSQLYLKRATGIDVPLTGDPALFIADPVHQTSKSVVSGRRLRVGLSIPFHGRAAAENWNRCSSAVVSALRVIQQKLDCDFHYFVHYKSEFFLLRVLKAMGFRLTVHYGSVAKLLSGYQGVDVHIGGMLHSCILAANYNVPLVCLAYDAKHHGFVELMGIGEQLITMTPDGLELLPELVQRTVANTHHVSGKILAARTKLVQQYGLTIRSARAQLGIAT